MDLDINLSYNKTSQMHKFLKFISGMKLYAFSLLYCACCQVTQLLYQPLHIYKFIKVTH